MPKTRKNGEPIKGELPGTVRRSSKEAQETFAKAHDSAAENYGEGERAHRVAYAALKHNHGRSYGGVDLYGHTKEELRKRAAELGVRGRSTMTKEQLASAIARKQG
jgi:cation transport regulator ChaB